MFNFTKILQEQLEDRIAAEERDYLHRLTRAAARISSMIDGVLAFTRVTRSQMRLQEVSVDTVVAEIIDGSAELQAPARRRCASRALRAACANPAGLHQCLANLLSNAVTCRTGRNATSRRAVETRGDSLRIWVEDNGIGIAEEEQATFSRCSSA